MDPKFDCEVETTLVCPTMLELSERPLVAVLWTSVCDLKDDWFDELPLDASEEIEAGSSEFDSDAEAMPVWLALLTLAERLLAVALWPPVCVVEGSSLNELPFDASAEVEAVSSEFDEDTETAPVCSTLLELADRLPALVLWPPVCDVEDGPGSSRLDSVDQKDPEVELEDTIAGELVFKLLTDTFRSRRAE